MQNRYEQIPRYGWDTRALVDGEVVTDVTSTTDVFERLPGLFSLTVKAVVTGTFGGNSLNMILEGSNTGDPDEDEDWFQVASLDDTNLFTAADTKSLATTSSVAAFATGTGAVSVGRYKYLRVRFDEVGGAVTYSATVYASGTAGDGQKYNLEIPIVSASGEAKVFATDYVARPSGTRWLTATAKVSSMILEPPSADGIELQLQGAATLSDAEAGRFSFVANGFHTPADPALGAADQSLQFPSDGTLAIDMAQYNYFRIQTVEAPSPMSDVGSFDITATLSCDDNDWVQGEIGVLEMAQNLRQMFAIVQLGTPSSQVGTVREVSGQFVDTNFVPIRGSLLHAYLVLSSAANAREALLHTTATASGSAYSSVENEAYYPIVTDVDGKFTVAIDSNATPTTAYLSFVSYPNAANAGRPVIIVSSDEATVTLA